MVNPVPILQTIATETWVLAAWEDFLTFANDPTLVVGRFYYDQGEMKIAQTEDDGAVSRWFLGLIAQ